MYAFFQLLFISLGVLQVLAQQNVGTYTLKVIQDVTLQGGSTNFNDLQYLIVGTHSLKRSLMKFEKIPDECRSPLQATLHIYFVSAEMTNAEVSSSSRNIVAHTVLKSWSESQATSKKRNSDSDWDKEWLNLSTDASSVASSSTTVQATPGNTWYALDVTKQAQDWTARSNNGLLLRDANESMPGRDFRFASNAYEDSLKHAFITLICSVQQQSATA